MKKMILLLIIGIYFLPFTQRNASAQRLDRINHIGQGINCVIGDGNYAYIGEGAGLRVLDVTDPTHPHARGRTALSGYCYQAKKKGNYVYTALLGHGMQVVDVSYPDSPSVVYTFPVSQFADTGIWWQDIEIVGNRLYGASGRGGNQSGIHIFDISNPQSPALLGIFSNIRGLPFGIGVRGNYVYACSIYKPDAQIDSPGIQIIDVSNPSSPFEAGYYPLSGNSGCYDIIFEGNLGYVAGAWQDGLVILDLTDPIHPLRKGSYDTPWTSVNVAKYQNYIYAPDMTDQGGTIVVNVSNPVSPTLSSMLSNSGVAYDGVSIDGTRLYIPSLTGLQIYSLASPATPTLMGEYKSSDPLGCGWGVTIKDGFAYVADWRMGLRIFSCSNPFNLQYQGRYRNGLEAEGRVGLSGNIVYVGNSYSNVLQMLNVSDKTNPQLVNYLNLTVQGGVKDIIVDSGYMYVAAQEAGVYIVDVNQPSSPQIKYRFDTDGSAVSITKSGIFLFVADTSGGLKVLNISNPLAPFQVSQITGVGNVTSVAVDGNRLGLGVEGPSFWGIRLYDITNQNSPQARGTNSFWSCKGMALVGNTLVTSSYQIGIVAYDISNMNNPIQIDRYETDASCDHNVFADGSNIYATDFLGGLNVFQFNSTNDPPTLPEGHAVIAYSLSKPSIDPEGDAVTYTYRWSSDRGDVVVHGPTVAISDVLQEWDLVQTGETWTVTVTPNDGTQDGPIATGKVKIIDAQNGVAQWLLYR